MKLLHTSDWHLGMTFKNNCSYKDDQKFFIDQITAIAKEESIDGIIIAGDIFDKGIASHEALKLYDYAMTKICTELDAKVFLIAGNHDGAERISPCNELLKRSGLYIASSLKAEPYIVNCDDVDIFLLPWITTEKVKTIYKDNAEDINSMEDAYKVVLDDYRSHFKEGHKNILLSHAYITNASTSESDRAAEVGKATMVNAEVFKDFDYVALGHIHGPQQIAKHIRYCGTPMPYSFGKEEKQEKSVTIIDTDSMTQKIVPLKLLHIRKTISGSFDELINASYDKETLDGYIKIDVTDKFVVASTISAFNERFYNLLEISGKGLEKENAKITMTIEEFENTSNDPKTIFSRYCEDILESNPSEHINKLFEEALKKYEEGEN